MSKIHVEQKQKALTLVAGLRKNIGRVENRGISNGQVMELEQMADELGRMNKELEDLRIEVSRKSKDTNLKSRELREKMFNMKKIVKRYFDSDQWKDFGVLDRR